VDDESPATGATGHPVVSTRSIPRTRRQRRSGAARESASPTPSSVQWNLLLSIVLAVVTVALYIPAIGHSFVVYDDREYVTANPHIHEGLGWSTIRWAFTSTYAANWHPLTWLSHALDYQLFALNPAGHHFASVLIHALNAALLFVLLSWITRRVGPSFLVAALFALHPINVESVAWVAERKNVLSTLFFLLAIGAYAWYARKPGWRRYLLVAVLFAAGLMAKPMVITLPFVLLLLDYWPLGRTDGSPASVNGGPQLTAIRLLLEKVPLLVLSAASAWLTLAAQRTGQAVRSFAEFPLAARIKNAVVAYGLYLWKMLWPAHLAIYPHSAVAPPARQWIPSALVLVGVTALVVRYRRKRYLPVGWFWFLGTLVPVIGLVQVGEADMADRYAYLPLVGIFIMIAWSLDDWAEGKGKKAERQKSSAAWQMIPAACVLVALALATHRQMGYWESQYSLLTHTLEVTGPDRSAYVHDGLGSALLDPTSSMSPEDLENFPTDQKRMDEARRHYELALDVRSQTGPQNLEPLAMALALSNLGDLDGRQNRSDDARRHYEEALIYFRQLARQDPAMYLPQVASTLISLGHSDRTQNQLETAAQRYAEAATIYHQLAQRDPNEYQPVLAKTLYNLGRLDRLQNKMDDARQCWEQAVTIYRQLAQLNPVTYQPPLAITLNDLGNLDQLLNRGDDAHQHYAAALQSFRQMAQQNPNLYLPSVAQTLSMLGALHENQNRTEESRADYQESLSLFRKLAQGDNRYSADVASAEARLKELNKKASSR
jgi:tetratricopeptide (TPR) repeat protein